ncbi:MAG: OmpA family protein [Candidatus Omnitrophica bacterium]|nr:OmpA family protein [Candidatus Omnitrophota bacterium]
MIKIRGIIIVFTVLFIAFATTGCTLIFQKGRRSDVEKIGELESKLEDLERARAALRKSLSKEIKDKGVKLEMAERGLVVTFLAEILFDSGKAKIKKDAMPILDKVADVVNEVVPDLDVGVEGHTDNQPIKHSRWQSNWELSTSRATSVVHYLIDKKGIAPQRLAAIGYGEYRPVDTNETKEGKRKNRRVEIVILPEISKSEKASPKKPALNLK